MNDSFPTLLFVVLIAAIVLVGLFGGHDDKPQREPIAAAPVEAAQRTKEFCDPLKVDPQHDRGLTAEQLTQKTIAWARCMDIEVIDCAATPEAPLCAGPPR